MKTITSLVIMARRASTLGALLACLCCGCASLDRVVTASPARTNTASSEVRARIASLSSRWQNEPVPVGLVPQVVFDDALIASRSENLERRMGSPVKHSEEEPIVKPEHFWEGDAAGICVSVVTNERGLFQMWYDCGRADIGAYTTLGYAESKDGLTWRKPRIPPSFDNIVMKPVFGAGIYYDAHDRRAGHRYKAAYGTVGLHGVSATRGVTFAHSSNGRKWSMYDEVVMLDDAWADTLHNIFWDPEIQRYRLYTRTFINGCRSSRLFVRPYVGSSSFHAVARALFIPIRVAPWEHVSDTPPPEAGEFYTMNVFKYGSIYVGQIGMWDEKIHYVLALSRDGSTWSLDYADPQQAFIKHGDAGSFDGGMIFPASTAPVEVGDKWLLYYGASGVSRSDVDLVRAPGPYQRSIGLATVRKEGFFYLESTNGPAELVTKSFQLEGTTLFVNADASSGALKVSVFVVADNGEETEWRTSLEIQGDDVRAKANWPDGTMAHLQGQTIRLRFDLDERVRLYGFMFAP